MSSLMPHSSSPDGSNCCSSCINSFVFILTALTTSFSFWVSYLACDTNYMSLSIYVLLFASVVQVSLRVSPSLTGYELRAISRNDTTLLVHEATCISADVEHSVVI